MDPVLIVGAGPTGLVLALWLQRKGIAFRIIDKASAPGQSSRALAIQARTLEFYRQLGIADEIIAAGIRAEELKLYRRGKLAATAPVGKLGQGVSPYAYLLFLSQDVHEDILNRHLAKLGVTIERNVELAGFTSRDDGVHARLKTPRGEESLMASYLCGCDGAHSTVRHEAGFAFPGGSYEHVFFVADVQAAGAMAQGGVQISLDKDGFCIVMPIERKNSIRLTGIVPVESEAKSEIRYDDVAASVADNTGLDVKHVNWFSTYRVHHRRAETFKNGRVFLCGDAGHIHSPAGGQGMNTGIGDAVNLAWKLAEVIQKKAPPQLLETYSTERVAFAKRLLATTDIAFRLVASRTFLSRVWRLYVMPYAFAALTRVRPFVRFMFRTLSQTQIEYRESALSLSNEGRLQAGDRLPWVSFGAGRDNFQPLSGLDWHVHIYGKADADFTARVTRTLGLKLHVFEWTYEAQLKGFTQDAGYLVRPDAYLAMVTRASARQAPHAAVDEIRNYFDQYVAPRFT